MFVDATGDAALSLHLNLPSLMPESLQPPTTCAKIAGLGALRRPGGPDFDWQAAVREHGAEFGLARGWGGAIPGLTDIQMRADTHVFGGDTSDSDWLTRSEMEGRRQDASKAIEAEFRGPKGREWLMPVCRRGRTTMASF